MRAFPPILALTLSLAACTGDGQPNDDMTGGDSGEALGRFELTTTIDATGALPPAADQAVDILLNLSEDPAGTLFDLLEQADVPVLDDLLAAVPSTLRDELEGWINDFLLDQVYQGVPMAELISQWGQNLGYAMQDFEVISVLDAARIDSAGNTDAIHTLSAVAFTWDDQLTLVDTPDIVDQLTLARDVSISVGAGVDMASLDVGDHAFHMPLGEFAVVGFNMAIEQWTGQADLAAALSAMFDCAGLAESVASKCLGPVCVGHADEIEAVCEQGIAVVAAEVEARIAAIDYAELRLHGGTASLLDAGKDDDAIDGRYDHIDGGVWQAMADVDGVAVPVDASFVGRRLGSEPTPE